MSAPSAYDSKHPTTPVPLYRQAEVAKIFAERWWTFYSYTSRTKEELAWKIFDVDQVAKAIADTTSDLAELAKLVGEERARAFLANALERARAEAEGRAA